MDSHGYSNKNYFSVSLFWGENDIHVWPCQNAYKIVDSFDILCLVWLLLALFLAEDDTMIH